MPLSIKRPTRDQFRPLIERVERRLETWQTKLISRGGRHQLVRSVLSSIPIYFMHCFLLPQWVIDRIDKARRTFLWGSSTRRDNGISLCNWEQACLPTTWGGLGLPNLRVRNISLILRWWWKGYKERNSMWGQLVIKIRWQGIFTEGPTRWSRIGSFFWTQLIGIKHLFNWSTSWEIGDGTMISYWYDAWGVGCLAEPGTRQINAALSLRDAVAANQDLITDHALVFTDQQDDLRWNWGPTYSAKSIYTLLMGGGRISWPFKQIWKQHIPSTVKIFTHLLLLDKVLTREVMMRRNFQCTAQCEMCDEHEGESSFHLFFGCGYAMQVWNRVLPATATSTLTLRDTVHDTWLASVPKNKEARKKWMIIISCTCWNIWKQRNLQVFEGRRATANILADWIVSEATLWEKYC